jgi:hypothetical protein
VTKDATALFTKYTFARNPTFTRLVAFPLLPH